MATAQLSGNVLDQNRAAVPGALVYVYDQPGGLADLTDSMAQSATNPVTADEDGYWSAYAENDRYYTLQYYWGGRLRYVETNILLGTTVLGIQTDPNVRTDLAAPTGAGLVKSTSGATGAVGRTVAQFINDGGLNVMEFGNGVGQGTASVDTAAWQAALNALAETGAKRLNVPVGEYLINATLEAPANLNSVEIAGQGGYDGVRGPINLGLFTSLKWVGATDATAAVVKFDQATGCVWRGVSINCDYKAGYGLQFMSSSTTNGGVKNTVERCSIHYALRDGALVGEWGEPTATPGQRQFFGNRFEDLTFYGCGYSAIHINEWNADQQILDSVMVYLDDAAAPQAARNAFWFDSGGQYSLLQNCQSGGQTIVPGEDWSGYMIRNQHADETGTGGAHGLHVINCWQEGDGGFYYGVTSTEDDKAFLFEHCASYTNEPASRPSVYIDKGTFAQIPYTFDTCTFLSDIEIASSAFNKESLELRNCIFASGRGLIGPNGNTTLAGAFDATISAGQIVVPLFAEYVAATLTSDVGNGVVISRASRKNDRLTLVLTQDGTGSRTVTWASGGSFTTTPPIPQPAATASARTVYNFVCNGSAWSLLSVAS